MIKVNSQLGFAKIEDLEFCLSQAKRRQNCAPTRVQDRKFAEYVLASVKEELLIALTIKNEPKRYVARIGEDAKVYVFREENKIVQLFPDRLGFPGQFHSDFKMVRAVADL